MRAFAKPASKPAHKKASPSEIRRSPKDAHKTLAGLPAHATFAQERLRCGKKACWCRTGEGHGPYWIAYWSDGGRRWKKYLGRKLPLGVSPPKGAARVVTRKSRRAPERRPWLAYVDGTLLRDGRGLVQCFVAEREARAAGELLIDAVAAESRTDEKGRK